jgi:hypothetical protein
LFEEKRQKGCFESQPNVALRFLLRFGQNEEKRKKN